MLEFAHIHIGGVIEKLSLVLVANLQKKKTKTKKTTQLRIASSQKADFALRKVNNLNVDKSSKATLQHWPKATPL